MGIRELMWTNGLFWAISCALGHIAGRTGPDLGRVYGTTVLYE